MKEIICRNNLSGLLPVQHSTSVKPEVLNQKRISSINKVLVSKN